MTLTRRAFLLTSGGAWLAVAVGCSGGGSGNADGRAGGSGSSAPFPFDMWEDLRTAARSSSDHTRAAAERAVATHDPEQIFAFVRDEIALYPNPPYRDVRWGPDGTLRCGAGTLREKTEVLADLYRRAGFDAQVVAGSWPKEVYAAFTALGALYATPSVPTDPAIAADDLERWRKQAGIPARSGPLTRFDPDGNDSGALAASVAALLPPTAIAPFSLTPPGAAIFVRVNLPDGPRLAIPLVGVPGLLSGVGDTSPPAPPVDLQAVKISVSMVTRTDPEHPITIVEGSWKADQVVGRQVLLQFTPPVELDELLQLRVRDVNLFVPTLSLRRPGDDRETLERNVITGTAVQLGGNVVEESPAGVTVGGVTVTDSGSGSSSTAATAVTSLTVAADAVHFPRIALRVGALDASGAPVAGLPTNVFAVDEDGKAMGVGGTRNTASPPRVLVVYDSSLSIGQAYSTDDSRRAFAAAFVSQVAAAIPGVEIQVLGTSGQVPSERAWAAPEAGSFGAAVVASQGSLGSGVYTAVAAAEAARPSVVVLISNGGPDDPGAAARQALRGRIADGVPVVAVRTTGADVPLDTETLADIAALSHGSTLTIADPTDVAPMIAAAAALLQQRASVPYELFYDADIDGATTRHLTVTINGISATATYDVPAPEQRLPAPGIIGLHMTITVGDDPPVVRTLGGLPLRVTADEAAVDVSSAIRQTLWSTTVVSFEGAAPSLTSWLDDLLTGKLAGRAIWDAVSSNDADAMAAAMQEPVVQLPSELIGLHAPLRRAEGEPLTFERLLRVAVYREVPTFNGTERDRSGDILPITSFQTADDDGAAAVRTTMARSARLLIGEQRVFDSSVASELQGAELVLAPDGVLPQAIAAKLDATAVRDWNRLLSQYGSSHVVVPATGAPLAFWAVDRVTGTLHGVLDDGTGGGRTAAQTPCDDDLSDQAFNALGALGGGVYAIVGKTCARIYARAGRTLTTGPVPDKDKGDPNDILRDFACDIAKEAVFGRLGSFGEVAGPIDDMADMFGSDLSCPGISPDGPGGAKGC